MSGRNNDDLYFIFSPLLNRIKIGRSKGATVRLSSFLTGSPDQELELLAVVKGAGHRERQVQRAWARFAVLSNNRGCEWFHAEPPLLKWIHGGCDFSLLPKQFEESGDMESDVPHRHDPRHVDALIRLMRNGKKAT